MNLFSVSGEVAVKQPVFISICMCISFKMEELNGNVLFWKESVPNNRSSAMVLMVWAVFREQKNYHVDLQAAYGNLWLALSRFRLDFLEEPKISHWKDLWARVEYFIAMTWLVGNEALKGPAVTSGCQLPTFKAVHCSFITRSWKCNYLLLLAQLCLHEINKLLSETSEEICVFFVA